MSHFTNVQEFLEHNQTLHGRIADYYRSLKGETRNERVKMLLSTLVEHETNFAEFLKDYIQQAPANTLDTYLQFDSEQRVDPLFENEFELKGVSCEEIEKLAHSFNRYLSDLYAGLSRAIEYDEVKALFQNLSQHMEEEKKRLSKDLNSNLDM